MRSSLTSLWIRIASWTLAHFGLLYVWSVLHNAYAMEQDVFWRSNGWAVACAVLLTLLVWVGIALDFRRWLKTYRGQGGAGQ